MRSFKSLSLIAAKKMIFDILRSITDIPINGMDAHYKNSIFNYNSRENLIFSLGLTYIIDTQMNEQKSDL